MKSFSFYTAAAILACNASAANVNDTKSFPDYSMVLVGGGLQTCSSVDVRYCSGPEPFTAASKSDEAFMLSPEHLANIADNAFWTEERVIEQQQTLALLEYMRSKVKSERVSERELLRMWRSAEIEIDGIWVSGRTNYSALSDRERNFVLDQLQVMAVVSTDSARSTPKRQKEFADLSKTKDGFTVEIYKKIVELAQQVAGSQRKPRILVVTASGRDPFAAVDMYVNVFKEAG
ncbi:hypothetical protein ORJ03_16635, partial [Rheinheimera baltica]|nr:hypothetical protein [Rheinheimera baltica]